MNVGDMKQFHGRSNSTGEYAVATIQPPKMIVAAVRQIQNNKPICCKYVKSRRNRLTLMKEAATEMSS